MCALRVAAVANFSAAEVTNCNITAIANCSITTVTNRNIVRSYANQTDFEAWLLQQLPALCTPPYPLRFVSVYAAPLLTPLASTPRLCCESPPYFTPSINTVFLL